LMKCKSLAKKSCRWCDAPKAARQRPDRESVVTDIRVSL
jgi:hypothetical protein